MDNIESFAIPAMWAGFIAFVLVMLALDLFVFGSSVVAGLIAMRDRTEI